MVTLARRPGFGPNVPKSRRIHFGTISSDRGATPPILEYYAVRCVAALRRYRAFCEILEHVTLLHGNR